MYRFHRKPDRFRSCLFNWTFQNYSIIGILCVGTLSFCQSKALQSSWQKDQITSSQIMTKWNLSCLRWRIFVSVPWFIGHSLHLHPSPFNLAIKLGLRQKNPAGEGRRKDPSLLSWLTHGEHVLFECFHMTAHSPGPSGDPSPQILTLHRKPQASTPLRAPRQFCSCILAGTCRKNPMSSNQVQAVLAFSTGTLQNA